MDVLTQEQTEDVQRLAAVEPTDEGYFQTSFWMFIRKRGPWLAALFVSEFFTGTALRHYDEVDPGRRQAQLLRAAAHLDGRQLRLAVGLAHHPRPRRRRHQDLATGARCFLREFGQGLVLGLMLAVDRHDARLDVGRRRRLHVHRRRDLVAIPLMGCTVGSMLPLLLRRLGVDPATSSTPFIATLIDVLGIIVYFNLAQIMLADGDREGRGDSEREAHPSTGSPEHTLAGGREMPERGLTLAELRGKASAGKGGFAWLKG